MKLARRTLSLGIAGAALSLSSAALASGFNTARFGTEWGHPTADNPTAIYYNPAAITQSEGVRLWVDGIIAYRKLEYTRTAQPGVASDLEPGNTGTARLKNVLAAPMIGLTWKLTDWLSFGGGFFVPFGGAAEFEKNNQVSDADKARFPGIEDGVARWYNIEGSLRYIYIGGGPAVKIGPVSLGFGAYYVSNSVETTRARTSTGVASVPNEGRSFFKVEGSTYALGAGVMVEAIEDKLFFGVSYQSQPGLGEFTTDGTAANNFQGTVEETKVNFIQELPDVIRFGGKFRPMENLELRAYGDFVRWSVFTDQCLATKKRDPTESEQEDLDNGESIRLPSGGCKIDENGGLVTRETVEGQITFEDRAVQNNKRDWNNAFGFHVGASYWINEDLEVLAGVAFDGNPVPQATIEPSLWDSKDIAVAAGGSYDVTDTWEVGLTYTHLQFLPLTVNDTELDQLNPPSRGPNANGKYKSWVGIVNIHLDWEF